MTGSSLSLRLVALASALALFPLAACESSPRHDATDAAGLTDAFDVSAEDAGPDDGGALLPREGKPLPRDVLTAAPDVMLVAARGQIELYARPGTSLSAEELADFAARSFDALTFDLNALGLDPTTFDMGPAVRVVVLDTRAYNAATGAPGTYGVTLSSTRTAGDAFVVPESARLDLPELDDTLAHEIVHMIQGRIAPNDLDHPWYFIEGMAIQLGSAFGRERNGRVTGFVPPYLQRATGADATLTFMRYAAEDMTTDLGQVGHDQAISGFFVEYLRVKHPYGAKTGAPDALPQLLGVLEDNSDGEDLDAAFMTRFHVSLASTRDGFVAFLDATRTNPAGRFHGTIFE